ncbi:MAG: HAMP domain-containing protein [Micromonosporaceae bacterium]|nr:HAMP domain-containing protein [Micromonosporaceae bacterium]
MSKRVKATQAAPPRRGALPRLRNVRIRSKLGVIMLVPVIALVAVAVIRLIDIGQSGLEANRAHSLMQLSERSAALTHDLQHERAGAADHLQKPDGHDPSHLTKAYAATDKAIEGYRQDRRRLTEVPETLRGVLNRIDAKLDLVVHDTRRKIKDGSSSITISDAAFQYRIVISDLIDFRKAIAQFAGNPVLADHIRAAAAISEVKEGAAREQIVVLGAISTGGFVPATKREFISTLTAQEDALQSFAALASPEQRVRLDTEVTGDKVLRTTRMEMTAARAPTERSLGISREEFNDAMTDRIGKLRSVESALDTDVKGGLKGELAAIRNQVVAESVAVLLVLFVATLIALLIARSMASSLRRLREGALAVAYESLPQSVARLRNPEALGDLSPEEVAAGVRDPVQVRGRDEIGQVAQAFNVVHREAVRTAAEQAALRANVATMFINLARRSQVLVDRLIGNLDRLERGEEDPDRLAQLFQLDHLATRMRRNDENLLVLAGADSTRMQRDPAPLSDVLRAAQSEVEQYTRVEFGIVDTDVDVAPHAVNDVVHLLAELFDNATAFSPPDTTVVVDARRAGDRAILQIEDRGIGISTEQLAELNAKLASPPLVDVAVSRMMGLVVVGRLATRHGVRVELRAARDRGTIADVILPAGALILPQRAGRQHTLGLPQARSPLALESASGPWRGGDQYGGDQYGDPRYGAQPYPGAESAPGWRPPQHDAPAQPAPQAGQAFDSGSATAGVGNNGFGMQYLPRRQPGDGLGPDGNLLPSDPQQRDAQPMSGFGGPQQGGRQQGGPERGSGFGAPPQPYGAGGPQPSPHARDPRGPGGLTPMNEVLGRRPAAEPAPRPSARQGRDTERRAQAASPSDVSPHASPHAGAQSALRGEQSSQQAPGSASRESIHSIEMPMGHMPLASPAIGPSPTHPPSPSAPRNAAPAPGRPVAPQRAAGPRSPHGDASARRAGASGDSSLIPPNVDDTMELPIFREVESAWFRTKQPEPIAKDAPAEHGGAAMERPATVSRPGPPGVSRTAPTQRASGRQPPQGMPDNGAAGPAVRSPAEAAQHGWQSAADDGWRRATEVAESAAADTTDTDTGLPKRVPMAQLVPGGVDTGATTLRNRSPEGVRGLLSAYHRGVQRGRTQSSGTRTGVRASEDEEQA